jgi:hypothetical protein
LKRRCIRNFTDVPDCRRAVEAITQRSPDLDGEHLIEKPNTVELVEARFAAEPNRKSPAANQ